MIYLVFLFIKILAIAFVVGTVSGIVFMVISTIYVFPYLMFIGDRKDKRNESVISTIKSATYLYKCWIKHEKPTF